MDTKNVIELNERMNEQLMKAPPPFLDAFQPLVAGDFIRAAESFMEAIPVLAKIDKVWEGVAYCCLAYILKEQGNYQDAILNARHGKECGLNLAGYWYYYDALIDSLDLTDRLAEAITTTEEAIQFYSRENSAISVADYLNIKINILKQIAWALSSDPMEFVYAYRLKSVPPEIENQITRKTFILKQMAPILGSGKNYLAYAKDFILDAIRSICEFLLIVSNPSEKIKEQWKGVSNIAARVGIKGEDLNFMEEYGNIKKFLEPYFGIKILNRKAVTEYYNMAVSAREKGNRQTAVQYFKEAFAFCGEEVPPERGFKALIAYQYGVCLWHIHGLQDYGLSDYLQEENLPAETKEAIKQIRILWKECVRLYSTLDNEEIADLDRRHSGRLTNAIESIERDPIMSESIRL